MPHPSLRHLHTHKTWDRHPMTCSYPPDSSAIPLQHCDSWQNYSHHTYCGLPCLIVDSYGMDNNTEGLGNTWKFHGSILAHMSGVQTKETLLRMLVQAHWKSPKSVKRVLLPDSHYWYVTRKLHGNPGSGGTPYG